MESTGVLREHTVPGPETAPRHSLGAHSATPPVPDTASAVVGWAAFSCVLVPVVLLWYGTSLAGAAGTALGLAAVTAACRVLLRHSERGAALLRAEERAPQHGRHGRGGAGVMSGAHGRSGAGAHRGGRRGAGNKPVD
ncbi:hypothetical protein [Streptomyces sp. NBC_00996]|uniref:hypothetical protein n=1 Tax=Streptomyces sp. NBC_00996 TaxID=2903710 RepID=UPI0038647B59|nr:hypothetical protein OG390_19110 [Streptomyces sp. NBC_00996]